MILGGTDKEAARIERRRKAEEERKARIYDPKYRTKAVDTDAISEQIRLKNEAKEAERQRDLAFDRERERNDQLLETLVQQREQEKRQVNKMYASQNFQNSPKSTRREWDLNDPAQIYAPEPEELGVSGLRIFEGEDTLVKDRKERQTEQMRDWIQQQAREKLERTKREKEVENMYEQRLKEINERLLSVEEARHRHKQAEMRAEKEYNKAQAELKKERETNQKIDETMHGLHEMHQTASGDFLTENPNQAYNQGKLVTYAYKGMSPDQLRQIHNDQKRQMEMNKAKRDQERTHKQQWDTLAMTQDRMLEQRVQELEAIRREELMKTVEENKRLAALQKERNRSLNQIYNTNQPQEGYFNQFNTSAR
ncbi:hypothetical protein PROFUN_00253 [Planoprotostelium fungivorum]|uniref:RIB43A-like with coiled-coils protein 2 n=1 Tax=Planoprotostelium fungivorum TaxID=1890364 RepID=A0A2P6NXV4_9EUKA|nr:hypothetical protein PROFUN_00253 [Planoprotostelium fungivorum]